MNRDLFPSIFLLKQMLTNTMLFVRNKKEVVLQWDKEDIYSWTKKKYKVKKIKNWKIEITERKYEIESEK